MKTASAALALPLVLPGAGREARTRASKRRYAVVGTGLRGIRMWGRELLQRHGGALDLVGLVDRNGKRAEMARGFIKTDGAGLHRLRADADRGPAGPRRGLHD